jgi:hypothetical protein
MRVRPTRWQTSSGVDLLSSLSEHPKNPTPCSKRSSWLIYPVDASFAAESAFVEDLAVTRNTLRFCQRILGGYRPSGYRQEVCPLLSLKSKSLAIYDMLCELRSEKLATILAAESPRQP